MATGEVPYEDSLEITTFIQPEDHPDREEEEQEDEQDEQEDEQDEQEDEQDEQQEAAEDDDEEGAEDEDPAAVNGDLSAIADKRANSDESELGGSIGELSSTVLFTIEETTAPQQASQSAPDERYQLRDDATPASEGVQFDLPTDIDIEIEGEVAPGRTVDVVATIEGSPVADATVEAGNQSTTTDDEGIAAVEIPFVAELRVVVERGDASGERVLDIPADRTTITVETEPVVPTNEMEISATVADEPLADGSVSIGNETVAETDGDGVASFDAPPDDATAVVERGEVTARTDVEPVSELDVEVLTRPIPGTDQTVRVTVDDRPVRNATVDVLGHEVGTTDGNGTVVFGFTGVTASYTATATVGAAEGTSDPQSVWPYWLAVLAAIGLLVGAVVRRYGVRRHVGTARSRAVAARDAVKRAVAYTRRTVRRAAYAIVDGLTAGFLWLYGRVAALGAWLAKLAEDASGTLLRTAKRIANGLKRLSEAETWVGFGRWLAGLPRRLVAAVLAVFTGSPSDSRSAALSAAELANDVDAEDPSVSDLVRIYQAWLRLASEVGYRRSMTPTEVADEAERRGFQSAPVQELTTVFQEIRYADRPVTSDRIETAVDALDRIAGDSE